MATENRNANQSFKQIEGDGWLSTYLPAISAATVMAVVLFFAISCSNKPENSSARIKAPEPAAASMPGPVTANAAVTPEQPKPKKVKKTRPANATYVNAAYGVSFSYPRKYSLQAGDGKSSSSVPANFVKPGAVEIASVDMPDSTYSDTDFSAGVLNVALNPTLTEQECAQFMPAEVAQSSDSTKSAVNSAGESTTVAEKSDKPVEHSGEAALETPKAQTVKVGSNQFTVIEKMDGPMQEQSDRKYFHTFRNGACYEFALDVETSRKPDEDLAQVDRGKVFQQLAKILTSARIKEVELPGAEAAQKPATDNSGAASAKPSPDLTAPAKTAMPEPSSASNNAPTIQEKSDPLTPQQK